VRDTAIQPSAVRKTEYSKAFYAMSGSISP